MRKATSAETKEIAERLCELQHKKGIDIGEKERVRDNLWIELSKDLNGLAVWYIWKRYSDQARPFFKTVTKDYTLSRREIEKILSNQGWICV